MFEKYILGDIMEIKYTKKELQDMESAISKFYDKNDLKYFKSNYVDPILLAKKLGFSVYSIRLGNGIDGLIGVDDKPLLGTESNRVIIVNKNAKSPQFKRFIIAHELAHYIDNNGSKSFAFRDGFSGIRSEKEQRMDYYAAAILMPMDSILEDIDIIEKINAQSSDKKTGENLDNLIIDMISEKYDVSEVMAERRLHEARTYSGQ